MSTRVDVEVTSLVAAPLRLVESLSGRPIAVPKFICSEESGLMGLGAGKRPLGGNCLERSE